MQATQSHLTLIKALSSNWKRIAYASKVEGHIYGLGTRQSLRMGRRVGQCFFSEHVKINYPMGPSFGQSINRSKIYWPPPPSRRVPRQTTLMDSCKWRNQESRFFSSCTGSSKFALSIILKFPVERILPSIPTESKDLIERE